MLTMGGAVRRSDDKKKHLDFVFELMDQNIYERISDRKAGAISPGQIKLYMCDTPRYAACMRRIVGRAMFPRVTDTSFALVTRTLLAGRYQLLKALKHMHNNAVFHRDVKPENILLKDNRLKLADFGSCRGINSKQPFTEYISTRWYRAPECLLTDGYYSYKMDVWSVGCVMYEVMTLMPLFPGANELDQINKIHDIMGTPSAYTLGKIRKQSR